MFSNVSIIIQTRHSFSILNLFEKPQPREITTFPSEALLELSQGIRERIGIEE